MSRTGLLVIMFLCVVIGGMLGYSIPLGSSGLNPTCLGPLDTGHAVEKNQERLSSRRIIVHRLLDGEISPTQAMVSFKDLNEEISTDVRSYSFPGLTSEGMAQKMVITYVGEELRTYRKDPEGAKRWEEKLRGEYHVE